MDLFLNFAIGIYKENKDEINELAKQIFIASDLSKNEVLDQDEFSYLSRTLDPN